MKVQPDEAFGPYNKSKYYRFYRDYGYDTKDFYQLTRETENFVQHGYLEKYIHGGAVRPDIQNPTLQLTQVDINN